MQLLSLRHPDLARSIGAAMLALVSATAAGCASPLLPAWTQSKTDRAVQAAANDESFPSAAQAGLASNSVRSSKVR